VGRPRGDDFEVVADDVGDNEAYDRRRPGRPGQQPALDRGQVFAYRVQLTDVGPGFEEALRDEPLVLQPDARRREAESRRRAARDEEKDGVIFAGFPGKTNGLPAGPDAFRVGKRMGGGDGG